MEKGKYTVKELLDSLALDGEQLIFIRAKNKGASSDEIYKYSELPDSFLKKKVYYARKGYGGMNYMYSGLLILLN